MTTILCPTRGGEASVPNQEVATRLAAENNARLVFLYVSDIHFLDHTAGPLDLEVIEKQLDEVGDFILTIIEEKAKSRGIDVETIVKRGDLLTALSQVITENEDISTVVFGSAIEGTSGTMPDYNQRMYEHLVNELGVEVIVTDAGEIIEHYHPNDSDRNLEIGFRNSGEPRFLGSRPK